jgi:hypothetical protein
MNGTVRSAALLCTIATLLLLATPLSSDPAESELRPLPAGDVDVDDSALAETSSDAATAERAASVSRVFDFSAMTARQRHWAQGILIEQCSFDWDRLLAKLNGSRVKVRIAEPPARAMFYPADPRVEVHRYFYRSERAVAGRLLAWETAHAVDIFLLSEEQRLEIMELYHGGSSDDHGWLSGDYGDQVGEAFMEGFTAAFCPGLTSSTSSFNHVTTPEIAERLREIV